MELKHYVSILWRWVWLIVIAALLAGVSSYLVSRSMPEVYEASTTLLVNQAQSLGSMGYNDILTSERLTKTYGELIRKRPIMEAVLAETGYPYSPGQLQGMVSVQVVRDTTLLNLRVENNDPQMAADLANVVARVFIEDYRRTQAGQVTMSRDAMQEQLQSLERSMRTVSAQLDQLRSGADGRSPEIRQAEVARLQNTLTEYQIIYSQLLRTDQDMRLAEARTFNSVVVVEPAVALTTPIKPKVAQNVMMAALVGLVLAVAVAVLVEFMDDTVKTGEMVARILGAPALGYVLRLKKKDAKGLMSLAEMSSRSPVVEAFRVLRSNLQFAMMDRPGRSLLVTSAGPGEGKTTTAVNLAQVMAQAGKRVIIVDADLRRPSVHRYFKLSNDQGLTTVLLDPSSLENGALRPTGVDNLKAITSGPLPPNPSELLGSPRMTAVLEELKHHADVVLFDSPPALVVTDPTVLAGKVDAVLLVVDSAGTRAEALMRAKEALERAAGPGKLLGAVLNKLTPRSAGYYYYYYYYYRYGYGASGRNGKGTTKSLQVGASGGGHSGD